MHEPQTYANHRRYVTGYHFILSPLVLILLGWSTIDLLRFRDAGSLRWMILAVVLVMLLLYCRTFALRAQDRLIVLEERLRLARLMGAEPAAALDGLRPGQLVALRFASDDEVVELARQALAEGWKGEQVKKRIQGWRPDVFRV